MLISSANPTQQMLLRIACVLYMHAIHIQYSSLNPQQQFVCFRTSLRFSDIENNIITCADNIITCVYDISILSVCIYVYMYVCVYVCMYVYMYMYASMYVYICMYIYKLCSVHK